MITYMLDPARGMELEYCVSAQSQFSQIWVLTVYPIRITFPLEVYLIEDEGGSTRGFEVVFKLHVQSCMFVCLLTKRLIFPPL